MASCACNQATATVSAANVPWLRYKTTTICKTFILRECMQTTLCQTYWPFTMCQITFLTAGSFKASQGCRRLMLLSVYTFKSLHCQNSRTISRCHNYLLAFYNIFFSIFAKKALLILQKMPTVYYRHIPSVKEYFKPNRLQKSILQFHVHNFVVA